MQTSCPVDSMPSKACRRCHRPRRSITAPAGPVPRSASGSWYNSIPSLPKMRRTRTPSTSTCQNHRTYVQCQNYQSSSYRSLGSVLVRFLSSMRLASCLVYFCFTTQIAVRTAGALFLVDRQRLSGSCTRQDPEGVHGWPRKQMRARPRYGAQATQPARGAPYGAPPCQPTAGR